MDNIKKLYLRILQCQPEALCAHVYDAKTRTTNHRDVSRSGTLGYPLATYFSG
jgi:hypothetical protein